jgi:hypothetical protein
VDVFKKHVEVGVYSRNEKITGESDLNWRVRVRGSNCDTSLQPALAVITTSLPQTMFTVSCAVLQSTCEQINEMK